MLLSGGLATTVCTSASTYRHSDKHVCYMQPGRLPQAPSQTCWYVQWRHTAKCEVSVCSFLFISCLSIQPTAEKITG